MLSFVLTSSAIARTVPGEFSKSPYFYVFGPDGDILLGAEDSELVLFIDVPRHDPGDPLIHVNDVLISIYDPDTGGMKDYGRKNPRDWDTITRFSVYGRELLDSKEFAEYGHDMSYFNFGPYSRDMGKDMGDFYRFKLVVEGIEGNDANLFRVKILPDEAESFSESLTFRLARNKGDKMYFYPQVPAGTDYIVVENYDLDKEGGQKRFIRSPGS